MATAAFVAPISPDCSDVELVAAIRRGSDAAFEELYSRYSRQIVSHVRGMVGDHGRAEDITQEIFISALRRIRETDRPIAFKPWIYEIAKNACIDSYRRTRRAQEVSLDAHDVLSSADRGRLTVVTTPDTAFDSKQALNDLRGAFGGLSESHHEILVLRELEGRSYRDIGERLGMSRPVVESTLFRARRRLAEEYGELSSGRRCEFVHKMVDSGPHYSLGIRDRRRIARHLAHCQRCRAHARTAGFDESILNMPSVAAKIAALLPIPVLRGRWSAFEGLSAHRARPSLLALRSVHTLAGSSDQIVGAGTGAGRGAATAAALVLAGVGGGLVTESSYEHTRPAHTGALHASVYPAHARATRTVSRTASRSSLDTVKITVTPGRVAAAGSRSRSAAVAGQGRARPGSSTAATAPGTTPAPTAAAPSSPAGAPGTPAPAASGAGAPTNGGDASPTSAGSGSTPAGTPTLPVDSSPTGTPPSGTVATTLDGVTGAVPQGLPPIGPGTGATQPGPGSGAIGGVVAGLGQVITGS